MLKLIYEIIKFKLTILFKEISIFSVFESKG